MDRESENVDLVPDNFDQEYSVEKNNIHQHLIVDTKSLPPPFSVRFQPFLER